MRLTDAQIEELRKQTIGGFFGPLSTFSALLAHIEALEADCTAKDEALERAAHDLVAASAHDDVLIMIDDALATDAGKPLLAKMERQREALEAWQDWVLSGKDGLPDEDELDRAVELTKRAGINWHREATDA